MAVLLGGCWKQDGRVEERSEAVREVMLGHADEAAALQAAIIGGDHDAIRAAAKAFQARLPVDALPSAAKGPEGALRAAAAQIESAPDLYAAGEAMGALASACGGCHEVMGVALADPGAMPAPMPAGPDAVIKAEMARHRWAAERMWWGLVLPSEAAFQQGADAMAAASLTPSGTSVGSVLPPEAAELEVRVHDLAGGALQVEDEGARARAWGEMLGTCATCHTLLGRGPAAAP